MIRAGGLQRFRWIGWCLLIAVASCSDTGERAPSQTMRESAPTRVISLIPSVTEMIVALGAAERLVARSAYDVDPALAHLPSVGRGLTPSLEQLTLLGPELVITWPDNTSRSVAARLEDLGVTVYSPEIETLGDIRKTLHELGKMLGLEPAADSLAANIDAQLQEVRLSVAGEARPKVFYVVWYDPPTTASSGTYIHELIEIAGGLNIFADAPGRWPQISLEEVLRRQPDLVLVASSAETPLDLQRLRSAAGWRELEAIRTNRVAALDANLFNRPGPKVTEAALQLAQLLHPKSYELQASP